MDIEFTLARPTENDYRRVLLWRNDAETRAQSFHTEIKEWSTFYNEYQVYFHFADLPPLFVTLDHVPVAFIKFQPIEDPFQPSRRACALSINIAPEYRGRGIGTAALIDVQGFLRQQGYDDVVAEIRKENTISQKTFKHAGYRQLSDSVKTILETNQKIIICRFVAQLTEINPPKAPFIIAEAGSNWRINSDASDMSMAKTLIDIAKDSGADAVKFQVFRPETLYVPNAGPSDYLTSGGINSDMGALFNDLILAEDMILELSNYCKKLDIEFMATPFSEADFKLIDHLVRRHKIASYEVAHLHLLELAAKSSKPLILSTGCATEDEIAWSVNYFRALGGQNLTLLQCTAAYPASPEGMNLNAIPWLKQRFKCEVGLSDHSRHPTAAPIAAIALGASVIEKHFTLSNNLPGPDHAFALEPGELKAMVLAVHESALMLGSSVKCVAPEEEELRAFARRGIQVTKDISCGEELQEGINIDLLRPGKQLLGLHPLFLSRVKGHKAARHLKIGQGLRLEDVCFDENGYKVV